MGEQVQYQTRRPPSTRPLPITTILQFSHYDLRSRLLNFQDHSLAQEIGEHEITKQRIECSWCIDSTEVCKIFTLEPASLLWKCKLLKTPYNLLVLRCPIGPARLFLLYPQTLDVPTKVPYLCLATGCLVRFFSQLGPSVFVFLFFFFPSGSLFLEI